MTDVVMQMMLGGQPPGGVSAANLPDLLATLAQQDPRMAALVQHLQVRLAARNNTVEAAAEAESPISAQQPEIVAPVKDPGRGQKLKNLAKTMFAELQALRTRNDMLADALGACQRCWGEDETCEYCGGDGRVGAYLISPKVFDDVVGPAVRQIRQRPPVAKPQTTSKGESNHAV